MSAHLIRFGAAPRSPFCPPFAATVGLFPDSEWKDTFSTNYRPCDCGTSVSTPHFLAIISSIFHQQLIKIHVIGIRQSCILRFIFQVWISSTENQKLINLLMDHLETEKI